MKDLISKAGINNIAQSTGVVSKKNIQTTVVPELESLYFEMEDNYHCFQVGLKTILECLIFAEKEEKVPKLPINWYIEICSRYDIPVETVNGKIYI